MDQYNVKEIEKMMKTDLYHGLSEKEAYKRLKQNGFNEITSAKKKTVFKIFIEQFQDPMVLILLCGAVLSVFLKEILDAFIICLVVVVNAGIGTFQLIKSEKALESLKAMMQPTCHVRREGKLRLVDTREVVLGDLIEFQAGDCIPCDIRLTATTHLSMDESLLSGESLSVQKNEFYRSHGKTGLSEKSNMVFMSTYVSSGRGKGIAVSCGMESEIGKIASLLNEDMEVMTPLQRRMNQLGKMFGLLAVLICGVMMAVSLSKGKDFFEMLLLAISLAVAAIPEGLPAVVTIVQSMGVGMMSKHHAIVRKLSAVETLGSVNIICSDKTGTLTQNKMSVSSTCFNHEFNQQPDEWGLTCMGLCHNVEMQNDELLGDASEKALVEYVRRFINVDELTCKYLKIDEVPFNSTRKKMSSVHQQKDEQFVFTKGSLEHVLRQCTKIRLNGKVIALTDYERKRCLEESSVMENQALRVFGFAMKQSSLLTKDYESEAVFLGMAGLKDPIKPEIKEAVETCNKAGIEVVMITGDSLKTALAIGKECGIIHHESCAMSGSEIDDYSDEMLKTKVLTTKIYARVSPVHKMRLVEAYQAHGKIVAMSGDGVNDAPALKKADVGIAMGKDGSDVCKSVSDIVLTDDHFTTIVKAIEAGRNIYLKIQKSVYYLLSCNLGEIMTLFVSSLFLTQYVAPLCAIQILWTNLVTDAFPALALGVEADEKHVMEEKPKRTDESLFANGGILFVVLNGLYIGTLSLVAFRIGLNVNDATAQSMAFMVLSLSQMFHAFNCRQIHVSIFKIGFFKNKWLMLTVVCGVVLQVFVCQLPFFNLILKTVPLDLIHWLYVLGLSMSTVLLNEISKLFN